MLIYFLDLVQNKLDDDECYFDVLNALCSKFLPAIPCDEMERMLLTKLAQKVRNYFIYW